MAITPGHELKVALALREITAREAARRAGISEWALSRILNDRSRPDAMTLRRVRAAIFDEGTVG